MKQSTELNNTEHRTDFRITSEEYRALNGLYNDL